LPRVGTGGLHAELADRDPAAAASILSTDGRRIVRALEVVELTGQPFAASAPVIGAPRWDTVIIGLDCDTELLDQRLAQRTDTMFTEGLVDEVTTLLGRGLRDGVTASRALGYAQVLADLDAGGDGDAAREPTFIGTRRYVRRQRDRGFAAITGSTGWMGPRPLTPTRHCGRGGTYPEQVIRFAKGHGTQNDFVVLGTWMPR